MAIQNINDNDRPTYDLREVLRKHRDESGSTDEARSAAMRAGTFEILKLSDMKIDRRYQGHLSRSHVNKLKREFDPRLVGYFVISRRGDGSIMILDGMHRSTTIEELGFPDMEVPCLVLEGLTYEEEAYLYYKFNENRRKKTPQERLKAAIEAREPWALTIRSAVMDAGFRLNLEDGSLSQGRITGAEALMRVEKNYRDGHLVETLRLIADTWGVNTGPRANIITGVADFLSVYRDVFDRRRFVTCDLKDMSQEKLYQLARDQKEVDRTLISAAFTTVFVGRYNNRLQKHKLPSREMQAELNKRRRAEEKRRGH